MVVYNCYACHGYLLISETAEGLAIPPPLLFLFRNVQITLSDALFRSQDRIPMSTAFRMKDMSMNRLQVLQVQRVPVREPWCRSRDRTLK